ncbi:MAG: hypothetical protein P8J59_09355, partial [Phycisphaerales bacterium]|nr:hypothetical protein [Phycisphaerales bacterium]
MTGAWPGSGDGLEEAVTDSLSQVDSGPARRPPLGDQPAASSGRGFGWTQRRQRSTNAGSCGPSK